MKGRNILIVLLAVVAVSAVAVAVWALATRNADSDDAPQKIIEVIKEDGSSETVAALTDTIDLPQFAWLNLTAGSKEQELTFKNPPQNFAYIRVSILLSDKTVLWTSGIIAPGKASDKVVLSKALSAGEYKNAILKYECFQDEEAQSPLNGAENTLTLKVY